MCPIPGAAMTGIWKPGASASVGAGLHRPGRRRRGRRYRSGFGAPGLNDNIWINPGEVAGNNLDDDGNGFTDDVRGWDFVSDDNDPMDVHGHGTHVSGTIAGDDGFGVTGVAHGARIMPVRVLDGFDLGTDQDVALGIRYAARTGADVINLSLGGGDSAEIESAVQYATNRAVVMAAGNDAGLSPVIPPGTRLPGRGSRSGGPPGPHGQLQ